MESTTPLPPDALDTTGGERRGELDRKTPGSGWYELLRTFDGPGPVAK